MKTLTLLLTLLFAWSTGFAQNNPIDFEDGGFGADFEWEVFENDDNPALEIIDNPDATGANTSSKVAQFTARTGGASFAGTITRGTGTYLLDETNRTIKIMVWKSVISDVGIKLETASGFSTGELKVANTVTNQWEELTFDFSDVPNPPEGESYDGVTVFPDFQDRAQENVIFFDNITFTEQAGGGGGSQEGNLLTNGDFEAGDDGSWTGNALDIRTEGGNSFNFADIAVAGNAFDVNLSQVVELIPGESYTLTFDASTGPGNTRSMVVGIGLNQAPFYADVETVNLTETTQTFTIDLVAIDDGTGSPFGGADQSRVLFDMGADVGIVVIDNVSLELAGGNGGGNGGDPTGELVTNGDFEAGDDGSWTGNALDIRTEGGNSFNFADVAVAGNAFDVNLSQVVELIPGESYTFSFDASTSPGNTRSMVVGIGLNQAPFYADVETVNLTETTQTFTIDLVAIDDGTGSPFGGADQSRVLFDMGADVGVVVIDNVSLELAGGNGGGADGPLNPIDFEDGGIGADFVWEVFENEDNPPLEIIDNPDPAGANTSSKVAQFTARANGASFAGTTTSGTGAFLLDETNRSISVMVWKTKISDVGIKLETDSGFAFPEIKVANTVTEEWEELTFDFSEVDNPPGEPWTGITVFPDFQERDQDATIFFDNITFSEVQDDGGNGGGQEGNLLTNGDFELGNDGSWTGNALDIRTEGGNSFNFADVAVAGNAFDVNLSQVVDLIPGESYTLTFDASTGPGNTRSMVVGIGLNQAPFYADVETVNLTETTQTFNIDLAAIDDGTGSLFGDEESRVIFDMGADVGIVVIDNVSLELALATSVEELDNNRPDQFALDQNFPNPFNPTTNISFTIPQSSDVKLEVFNAIGQKVATLVNGVRNAGSHTITFDASRFASGVYLYRLTSGNNVRVNKMLLLK